MTEESVHTDLATRVLQDTLSEMSNLIDNTMHEIDRDCMDKAIALRTGECRKDYYRILYGEEFVKSFGG